MSDFRYPLWVRGDLDGFFGLMVDNLVQVLLIVALCTSVAGLPSHLVYERVLPGVAISLAVGNVFYGLQARRVARRDRNAGCTALPYGINTPSVFAFALFVMGPVYRQALANGTNASEAGALAWKAGLFACVVSGLVEFACSFVAEGLRRVTPRAALLGVLAALGVTFIASDFAFRIFSQPVVALVPMFIILLVYFARYRFPFGVPGGFVAILVGTVVAWVFSHGAVERWSGIPAIRSAEHLRVSWEQVRWMLPTFCGAPLREVMESPQLLTLFLTVSVPMGLINALGSLQNIESAAAAGDRFPTAPSLAVNGIGTLAAALFGSCFPTTIYIGHPGWKALGARAGYSILNGIFFTVCFLAGLGPFIAALIPIEAGAPIVMWIGIVITAQAFQTTPRRHAPAVAFCFFPAMAAMLLVSMPQFLQAAGAPLSLGDLLSRGGGGAAPVGLAGMVALMGANQGWLIVALILSAVSTELIDRRFGVAALWCAAASLLTLLGLIHAYRIEDGNVLRELFIWQTVLQGEHVVVYRGYSLAIGYALTAALLAGIAWASGSAGFRPDDAGEENEFRIDRASLPRIQER